MHRNYRQKNDEIGLLNLSKRNEWPIYFFSALELSKVNVPTPSNVVLNEMGTASVAEAAAIGVAHPKWDERPVIVVVSKEGSKPDPKGSVKFVDNVNDLVELLHNEAKVI